MTEGASRTVTVGAADLPVPPRGPGGRPRATSSRQWLWALAPAALGAATTLVARQMPERVEALYSRGLYPKIGTALHGLASSWAAAWDDINGRSPGDLSVLRASLAEALLGIAVGVLLVVLWRAFRRGVGVLLRRMLVAAGLIYLAFLVAWGLNHARVPLAETLGLELRPYSAEVLSDVALELERDLSSLLRDVLAKESATASSGTVSSGTVSSSTASSSTVGSLAASAWAAAIQREPSLGWEREAVTCAPLLSSVLSAGSITGIFSPFTQEALVVQGLPAVDLAFTACHEIAHVQGWAREDEANYLAWRVGSRSESPSLRIAAYTLALVHVHQALQKADPALQHERALGIDIRIATILGARAAYWSRTRSRVATRAMQAMNHTYLKSQGHGAGVASYGRMVDLIVAELR